MILSAFQQQQVHIIPPKVLVDLSHTNTLRTSQGNDRQARLA